MATWKEPKLTDGDEHEICIDFSDFYFPEIESRQGSGTSHGWERLVEREGKENNIIYLYYLFFTCRPLGEPA